MSGNSEKSPIVTLTPAPTLDRTYLVTNLHRGEVNRADSVGEELAGKGINVARALHLAGIAAPAVVPIGNAEKGILERTGSKNFLIPMWIEGTLRVSTTILEKGGPTTKINEAPKPLTHDEWQRVIDLTEATVIKNEASWLVIAGALPIDQATETFVDLHPIFERMKKLGVRVALDTSGAPLAYWVRQGEAAILKPNAEELASAVKRSLLTNGDVIEAARELCSHGVECVLASLGSDGMLAVTKSRAWGARTNPVEVINTVGAGDATLAGFLTAITKNPLAQGHEDLGVSYNVPVGAMAAVQWGATKVSQPTSGLENIDNLPEVFLTDDVDLTEALKEPAIYKEN
jgi:1-phosphofructokinase